MVQDRAFENIETDSTDSLLTPTVVGVASRLGDDDRTMESSPPLKVGTIDCQMYSPKRITPDLKPSHLLPPHKQERSRSTPIPAVIKASRAPVRPSGTLSTEPQPRVRIPGRTATKPRRAAKSRYLGRDMRVVLMLMHERSGTSTYAKTEELDIACAIAADTCMMPLKFVDFALCRPEDRRHDITAQVGPTLPFFYFSANATARSGRRENCTRDRGRVQATGGNPPPLPSPSNVVLRYLTSRRSSVFRMSSSSMGPFAWFCAQLLVSPRPPVPPPGGHS